MRYLALVILCFSLLAGCKKHEDPAKVKASIEEMNRKFVQAFNNKNLDGIMASYWNSPELISLYPDGEYRGYDATKASWKKTFDSAGVKSFDVTESHIEVMGNTASDWGMWTYTFQPAGGPEMTMRGRYSQMWAEKNGKWVVVADHASTVSGPPPATPTKMN